MRPLVPDIKFPSGDTFLVEPVSVYEYDAYGVMRVTRSADLANPYRYGFQGILRTSEVSSSNTVVNDGLLADVRAVTGVINEVSEVGQEILKVIADPESLSERVDEYLADRPTHTSLPGHFPRSAQVCLNSQEISTQSDNVVLSASSYESTLHR